MSPENAESKSKKPKKPESKFSLVEELYIDVLGSMVPGLFTIMLGFAMVLWTLCTIYRMIGNPGFSLMSAMNGLGNLAGQTHYELAMLMLVSAFILGVAFYRQDPKRPDGISALHVWSAARPEDRPGLAVQEWHPIADSNADADHRPSIDTVNWKDRCVSLVAPRLYLLWQSWWQKNGYPREKCSEETKPGSARDVPAAGSTVSVDSRAAQLHATQQKKEPSRLLTVAHRLYSWRGADWCSEELAKNPAGSPGIGEFDAQFPYLYMRCYLAARGLSHLLEYIPWCPQLQQTRGQRTKMLMNIFKMKLNVMGTPFTKEILRNEGHVRLATSVWYVSRLLFWLGFWCLLVIAGGLVFRSGSRAYVGNWYGPVVFVTVVMGLCAIMRFSLRRCLHYMRVREVVYVLEYIHLAKQAKPDLLSDMDSVDASKKCKARIDCGTCSRVTIRPAETKAGAATA